MNPTPRFSRPGLLIAAGLAWLAALGPAAAGEHGRSSPAPPPALYTQECGSCHLAYPPALLPAASWTRLMAGLDRHFGSDASLDADSARRIASLLQAGADARRTDAAAIPQDRITRTPWFVRKHRHIDDATWQLPSVRTPAQCAACHTDAERGRFSEHALRMPAGLSARQRAAWED